jgi:hypothetical protein
MKARPEMNSIGLRAIFLLLIATLCLTNYLAIFNDTFRGFFRKQTLAEQMQARQMEEELAMAKAQMALMAALLGVDVADLAVALKNHVSSRKLLEAENRNLSEKLGTVSREKAEVEKRTRLAAKKAVSSVSARSARSVARNIAGAAGESLPVIGTAIVAGMVYMDVKDACDTLKDLNEMSRAVGVEPEDESRVCGVRVPSQEELASTAMSNWKNAYRSAAEAIGKPITLPSVSWDDLKKQVCAMTGTVPMVCSGS